MSLTDARREVSAMRATFSDALVEGAEACNKVANVLNAAARGEVGAERVSHLLGTLSGALGSLRDATMTWAAMDTLMREVER